MQPVGEIRVLLIAGDKTALGVSSVIGSDAATITFFDN